MSVILTLRSPPARMPAWYPPQDPAAPFVYELSAPALELVQRVLQDAGVATGPRGIDGSVASCTTIARALREAVGGDGVVSEGELTESMRNDLFHFGAFNAVAADSGGYVVVGQVPGSDGDNDGDDDSDDDDDDSDDSDDDDEVPFADWADVREWVVASYEVEDEGGEIFSFVVDWTDTERTQRVIVRPAVVQDEPCVVLASFVARREQVDPWILLSRNLEDALTAFGVDDEGRILLTCTFPLALLTAGRFDALVDVLAARADDAEEEFTSTDEF